MNKESIFYLTKLRIIVGFLGEKEQLNWWSSSFFSTSSNAFITPVFGKTSFIAQCQGIKEAASRIHDEYIGVGKVYHLFRLPEELDQEIFQILHNGEFIEQIKDAVTDQESALNSLADFYKSMSDKKEGPVLAGKIENVLESNMIEIVARLYHTAFTNDLKVYPYYSDKK